VPGPAPAPAPARASASPALLSRAVESYLSGRYAELEQLDPAALADNGARSQLLLLRAAARFIRAEMEGDGVAASDAAASEIRAARSANPALVPDASMFPPRFRALWQKTR
jgi:hypothetical protein